MVTRIFGALTFVFARRHQLRFIMVLLKQKKVTSKFLPGAKCV